MCNAYNVRVTLAGKLDDEMRELDERIAQLEAALAKGVEANPDMGMSKEEVET